jgi:hypothetical protein
MNWSETRVKMLFLRRALREIHAAGKGVAANLIHVPTKILTAIFPKENIQDEKVKGDNNVEPSVSKSGCKLTHTTGERFLVKAKTSINGYLHANDQFDMLCTFKKTAVSVWSNIFP